MMPVIEIGDVIAILGRGWISGLISSFSGPVSHVGVVTCNGPDYDNILVTQAMSTVQTITLADTLANAKYGYCLHNNDLTGEARDKIANYAIGQVGNKYPYSNIFFQMLKQVTGNPKWTEFMDKSKEEICSELVAYSYLEAGLDFGVSPRDCTPSDCFNHALNWGWLIQKL